MLAKNIFDSQKVERIPARNGYGEGLVEAGTKDPNVVVLCCDLTESTRSLAFQQQFPDRFIEVGVAEQNMAGIAAGLALEGKVPFCSSYAVFNPGRNWDQIRVSVCYNKANVKIAGAHAGISVGPDGATHQALEDMAIMRVLPNMVVIAPCDSIETKKATLAVAKYRGPVYLRFGRSETPVMTTKSTPFVIGQAEIFRTGKDVTIVGCGALLYEALMAAHMLSTQGIQAEVINNHTIKPFDGKTLIRSAKKTGAVVTIEEHQVTGALAGVVAETLGRNFPVPLESVGMQDSFGESGEPFELVEKYHMTAQDIIKAVKKVLHRKNK